MCVASVFNSPTDAHPVADRGEATEEDQEWPDARQQGSENHELVACEAPMLQVRRAACNEEANQQNEARDVHDDAQANRNPARHGRPFRSPRRALRLSHASRYGAHAGWAVTSGLPSVASVEGFEGGTETRLHLAGDIAHVLARFIIEQGESVLRIEDQHLGTPVHTAKRGAARKQ